MATKNRQGALTKDEKAIVKGLLAKGWRGQDILALVNTGRRYTTNSGRITGVKTDKSQATASDEQIQRYMLVKQSHNLATGLNPFFDERLCKAREAMLLAVQLFNNPLIAFKGEVFSVLCNIAWTYLLHEKFVREKKPIVGAGGKHIQLSGMLHDATLELEPAIIANLLDVKELRDKAEHSLLGRSDELWRGLFQANCLNFDKVMCRWFGEKLTLQSELSFSLQFSKSSIEQIVQLEKFDVPPEIAAFNKNLKSKHAPEVTESAEYEFSVIYTTVPSSKAKSHFQFISPDSAEGVEIASVLVKHKSGDELYPYKPKDVIVLVAGGSKKKFTMTDHTNAWKKHKVRPPTGMPDSKKTNSAFCMYHKAHNDYTYN